MVVDTSFWIAFYLYHIFTSSCQMAIIVNQSIDWNVSPCFIYFNSLHLPFFSHLHFNNLYHTLVFIFLLFQIESITIELFHFSLNQRDIVLEYLILRNQVMYCYPLHILKTINVELLLCLWNHFILISSLLNNDKKKDKVKSISYWRID